MKTVNLNVPFIGLDGQELRDQAGELTNAGKTLANSLAGSTKGDILKSWSLAQRLYAGEEMELDPADIQLLKDFVTNSDGFTVLAKAQIIEKLQ